MECYTHEVHVVIMFLLRMKKLRVKCDDISENTCKGYENNSKSASGQYYQSLYMEGHTEAPVDQLEGHDNDLNYGTLIASSSFWQQLLKSPCPLLQEGPTWPKAIEKKN